MSRVLEPELIVPPNPQVPRDDRLAALVQAQVTEWMASANDIVWLEELLEDRFTIPGTDIRIGLDAIVGLIPVVGDAFTAVAGSYLIARAKSLGVGRWTRWRMTGNMVVDLLVGVIPFVGDLADIGWRSNKKNLRLIREHLAREAARRLAAAKSR